MKRNLHKSMELHFHPLEYQMDEPQVDSFYSVDQESQEMEEDHHSIATFVAMACDKHTEYVDLCYFDVSLALVIASVV
jgi:hypothetical protein